MANLLGEQCKGPSVPAEIQAIAWRAPKWLNTLLGHPQRCLAIAFPCLCGLCEKGMAPSSKEPAHSPRTRTDLRPPQRFMMSNTFYIFFKAPFCTAWTNWLPAAEGVGRAVYWEPPNKSLLGSEETSRSDPLPFPLISARCAWRRHARARTITQSRPAASAWLLLRQPFLWRQLLLCMLLAPRPHSTTQGSPLATCDWMKRSFMSSDHTVGMHRVMMMAGSCFSKRT